VEDIRRAAMLYATGGFESAENDQHRPSTIYQTLAYETPDVAYVTSVALNNLALLTGNVGRAGAGVIAFRGPANFQGSIDVGCAPQMLPGYRDISDNNARRAFEAAWLPRWNDTAVPQNGFKTIRSLPDSPGLTLDQMIDAIDNGQIKAMYIAYSSFPSSHGYNQRLLQVLSKLEFLVVEETFPSPLTELADVVLPGAMFLEKDGSFTNADRTIQRVRVTMQPTGDIHPGWWYVQEVARRLGYNLNHRPPTAILDEITKMVPLYQGVSFPRLERGPMQWPTQPFGAGQKAFLSVDSGLAPGSVQFMTS